MKRFWKWLDENFEETLLMILLVAISVVMMAQVVMRYFFRQSMSWPEEFCRFCFVYSGFISMGYCVRKGKMLKVDILLGLFPAALQKLLDLLSRVITLVFFVYLTYHAWLATANSMRGGMKSAAMELPMWIIYAAVLIGAFLGSVRQVQDLYKFFKPAKEEAMQ
ncbi:MAG: TRAP transporter small permease [Ruminococcaceae bacterium]|nr:TRAP transporter small permease [Oscillospiraceae bacterium]